MHKVLVHFVDEVPLTRYLAAFCVVVLGCGGLYSILTPYGHGTQVSPLGLLNGIYFSIVTISSLGYGDFQPVGFSKAIACFEVLFGLSFMGIVVARMTSRRLSHHVRRLYISDAQKRLDDFSEKFSSLKIRFIDDMKALGSLYQKTPQPRPPGDNKEQILSGFRNALSRLQASTVALEAYFSSEVEHEKYFSIIPSESVRRVGTIVDELFWQLGQIIISLPAEGRSEVLDGTCRQMISETMSAQQGTCRLVLDHCQEPESVKCFRRIQETCKSVLDGYFSTPPEGKPAGQPDQRPPTSDAPQYPGSP